MKESIKDNQSPSESGNIVPLCSRLRCRYYYRYVYYIVFVRLKSTGVIVFRPWMVGVFLRSVLE